MASKIEERLEPAEAFKGAAQDAMLSVLAAASELRDRTERACRENGVGSSHYNVLRILRGAPEEGYSRGDIIERMLDPAPDVTRLIDALAEKGMVRRRRGDEDRRRTHHWITDVGAALLDSMADDILNVHTAFADRFSEAELAQLSLLCKKIYARSEKSNST